MAKKTKITKKSVEEFVELLYGWVKNKDAYFLSQFREAIGMTEMQFYRRVWKAEEYIPEFDSGKIKEILRMNRWERDNGKI